MLNRIQLEAISPAYGSEVCLLIGRFGNRSGDRFYSEFHRALNVDHNAYMNYLARLYDPEIMCLRIFSKSIRSCRRSPI